MIDAPILDVRSPDGTEVARLCPLTADDVHDDALVNTLSAWRNEYRTCFIDTSESTLESTRAWLERLLGASDRVLFIVRSVPEGTPIAQYGLRDITATSAELDNGILGHRGGPASLFFWIQSRVLQFCEQRGLRTVRAQVLSSNTAALFLHHRSGLRVVTRRALPDDPGREIQMLEKTVPDPVARFEQEVAGNVARLGEQPALRQQALAWALAVAPYNYVYNFSWMGRPIIQYPQDMVAMQEIIWRVKPEMIVETGVAHGGSLVYYASLLKMMDLPGTVVGIDIDIRSHNRKAITEHPMGNRIQLVQGSSVDPSIVDEVTRACAGKRTIVCLDSNHTHDHVLGELRAYSPLVGVGSYLVVFDTVIEDMPATAASNRPWGKSNNPKTAVHAFLQETDRFEIDRSIEDKIQLTVCPDGFLKCTR